MQYKSMINPPQLKDLSIPNELERIEREKNCWFVDRELLESQV